MGKIKDIFGRLSPQLKKWVTWGVVLVLCLALGWPIYKSRTKEGRLAKKKGSYQVLDYDPKTFEKSLLNQTKAEVNALRREIDDLKKLLKRDHQGENSDIKDIDKKSIKFGGLSEKDAARLKKNVEGRIGDLKTLGKLDKKNALHSSLFPVPSNAADKNTTVTGKGKGKNVNEKKDDMGIAIVVAASRDTMEDYVEKPKSIYLPPSFMDASLLSGVVAPTTNVGKSHPIPMLIRVKDLAVLPNEVKRDLKGCFVVAEGSGDLSQERVATRLLTLSCVSKKGNAIIDQEVKGWVVDADGRAGLSGRVVAKFGAHIARVAIAGFLEGFGKALETSVSTIDRNLLGTTTTTLRDTDTDTIAEAGIGRGIVNVAEDLQKFYLELAQQTLPVIEVGPTKNITLIISEGVKLSIKKLPI